MKDKGSSRPPSQWDAQIPGPSAWWQEDFPCFSLCCHVTKPEEWKEKGYKENRLFKITTSIASPGVSPCCQDLMLFIAKSDIKKLFKFVVQHAELSWCAHTWCRSISGEIHLGLIPTQRWNPKGSLGDEATLSDLQPLLQLLTLSWTMTSRKVRTSFSWPNLPKNPAVGWPQPAPSGTFGKRELQQLNPVGPEPASEWEDVLQGSSSHSWLPEGGRHPSLSEAAGHKGKLKTGEILECRGTTRTVSLLPQSSWRYFGRAVLDLGTEVCLTAKSFFGFGLKTLCSAAFVLSSRLRTQGEFGLTIFFLHSHEESCEFVGMEIW